MKKQLRESELVMLSALQAAPRSTAVELARVTKYRVSSIQYALNKFQKVLGVQVRPSVNSYRLGIQNVAIFFSPVFSRGDSKTRLLRAMEKHPKIPWACEFVGEYQFGLTVHCRYVSEVSDVVRELCDEGRISLADKQISPRISYRYFGRGYLTTSVRKRPFLEHRYDERVLEIDDLDRRILGVLSNESFSSIREAARMVGTPSSTFDQRLRRLTNVGIISGDIAHFSPAIVGRIAHRLMFQTQMFTDDDSTEFVALCARLPDVVSMNETLGTFDREVVVEVSTTSDVSRIVGYFYTVFGAKIRSCRTLIEAQALQWRLF
jgi:DNA-binding Lrp family transcriptional regulator